MSDQKKQLDSQDNKAIIGDVKKSLKEQEKKQDLNVSINKQYVVVGSVDSNPKHIFMQFTKGFKRNKKGILIGLVIILLIVIVSVIGIILVQKYNSINMNVTGDSLYPQQKASYEQELKNVKTKDEKAIVLEKLTLLESTNGDYKSAQKYAAKSVKDAPNADTYSDLAFTASQNKDYKLAAYAYGKAAELSPKTDNLDENSSYNNYMMQKKQMENMQ